MFFDLGRYGADGYLALLTFSGVLGIFFKYGSTGVGYAVEPFNCLPNLT